ncbi:hypothetical protein ACFVVX_29390 [Kitasatospora sp. NPDC058170]|uniref:hypothetical protein n=1 Tax=Kitasatospora sp. NPDC058170 TaxID=3346364 RepID=UPI0036D93725
MTTPVVVLDRYDDVTAALADPALVPVPAEPGPPGGVAWLRATVARFSAGGTHTGRRALVEADLARLDPARLRLAAAAGFEADARLRAVRVLAQALGLAEPEAVARAVAVVAGAYFADRPEDREADAAMAWLLPRMLPDAAEPSPEHAANRIGLLVQACDATGRLVDHARRAAAQGAPPAGLLAETLRQDPPVRAMRRQAVRATTVGAVAIPAGAEVVLETAVAAAGCPGAPTLAFGAAPRVCPGREHALALASGILHGASEVPASDASDRTGGAPVGAADAAAPSAAPVGAADAVAPAADAPATDGRDPAEVVTAMVGHVLALAAGWTDWDGRPLTADGRTYTPHKAIRRVTDHLIDHLAELEARLAGEATRPDHWHASAVTTPADLAPFTAADLDEARSRLTRLGRVWAVRLAALTPAQLDRSPGTGWTFRQLAFHVAESAYYADAVGDLTRQDKVGS